MKKSTKYLILAISMTIIMALLSIKVIEKTAEEAAILGSEYGYFEGQKDALQGDIRIKQIDVDCFRWIKSPWDDVEKEPSFNICKGESKSE